MIALATAALLALPATDDGEVGREIVALVREHFYDRDRAAGWADRHADYADDAGPGESFADLTNRLLDELGASHTHYYTPDDVDYYGLKSIFGGLGDEEPVTYDSIGVAYADDRFVRVVFARGPAERAGLRRGDEILTLDGRPFHPIGSLAGRLLGPAVLTVRRQADAEPFEVEVFPGRAEPKQEWLVHQNFAARVVERDGARVAYMPFVSCGGEEHEEALMGAMVGDFADADALVLDFRGGWGGCSPTFLDLFNPVSPDLAIVGENGTLNPVRPTWRKPLVLLVDGATRSGKEVVAFAVKTHRLGLVVGERTAGAVLAGRPFVLSDGSILYLAVADVRVDGERLEGVGVAPDVEVADEFPYADGEDPQLDRAIEVAAGLVRGE